MNSGLNLTKRTYTSKLLMEIAAMGTMEIGRGSIRHGPERDI